MILQRGTGITKWWRYYKLGQLIQTREVQKENERNKGGQQILATDSLIHPWFASWQIICSQQFLRRWTSVWIIRNKKAHLQDMLVCVAFKSEQQITYRCFLYWKPVFSYKIFRKLTSTKSYYSNVASATLLKSLPVLDIFLQILQELYLKNTSERLLVQLLLRETEIEI